MSSAAAAAEAAAGGWRAPFTESQWVELEHQALIFKYLMAGVPVPPDLLVPIRRSFDALPTRYYHPHHHYHHAALDYHSYYGKKLDPEPGRCRRTDGKKWRCSKDAYPGSKYCERHMHRGRNRSRKSVESQTTTASSQSQSASSSTVTGGDAAGGSSGGSFRTSPLPSLTASNSPQVSYLGRASSSQLQMDSTPYGIKYISGAKAEVGEHSFFSEASGSTRGLRMDSSVNNSWRLMPSSHDASSFPLMETRENSILESASSPLHHPMHINSLSLQQQQQQQYSFLGSGFSSANPVVKHENQPLQPFFDEWPRTKDSWSDIEDERSNRTSLSTTQLSISIPMVSSAFSTTSSRSPNDD